MYTRIIEGVKLVRAMMLAAGLGTRLRPLTNDTPKCLVPIKGQPLLGIWLDHLTKAGIGPFLINTHYLATQVETFIEASPYVKEVKLVHEPNLRGTAGTLISHLDFFQDEDGLLIHADNYCLADFKAFQKAHISRPSECLMTMMIFRTEDPSSCGIVDIDERGVVIGFYEKQNNPPGNLANGAVYILSPGLLNKLRGDLNTAQDFSLDIIKNFIGHIFTYQTKDILIDIGTQSNYEKALSF